MVRVFSLIVVFLVGVVAMVHASEEAASADRPALWKLVAKAKKDGLPKTAVKHLTTIYGGAVADGAFVEATRAYCAIAWTEGEINQPMQPYIIRKLQADVPGLPAEMKPVMQVIQADWFLQYYFQNRWKFAQRSQTGVSPSEDFETWDLPRLLNEIDRLFEEALSNADALKQTPVSDYASLLEMGTISAEHRPTMYDFLAHRAISFYSLDEQIVRREDAFELKADSPVFSGVEDFMAWTPNGTQNESGEKSTLIKAVELYQELLRFHADDQDPTARLDANLWRLRFAHQRSVGDEKTVRYRAALQRFADQHAGHELSSLALAFLAASLQSDEELAEAHAVASIGMKRFPESLGGCRCFNLIQQIEVSTVSVLTERVWNEAKPEFQVTYKNLNKLYFRLVPFDFRRWDWGKYRDPENMERKERQNLAKRQPLKEWSVGLLPTPDYQTRTNSINAQLDVPSGCYLLLTSMKEGFEEKDNRMAVTHVWVTDLNVITRTSGAQHQVEGQISNALSGKPIEGANVSVYRWKNDGKNSREISVGSTKTDADGFYRQLVDGKRNSETCQVFVQHANQKIGFVGYSNRSRRGSGKSQQTLFFTDRSIYRPGSDRPVQRHLRLVESGRRRLPNNRWAKSDGRYVRPQRSADRNQGLQDE